MGSGVGRVLRDHVSSKDFVVIQVAIFVHILLQGICFGSSSFSLSIEHLQFQFYVIQDVRTQSLFDL